MARNGAEYIFSGLPSPLFNVVVITERPVSQEALRRQGREACEWAGAKGVPWLLVVTHEALTDGTDADTILGECGLAPMAPLTGMVAGKVVPVENLPEGLELTQPQDDVGCAELLTVNGAASGVSLDTCIETIGSHRLWKDQFAVVGRVGGKPVSCAAVLMVDGYRYVAFVATNPEHQRRGYADAAMRHALDLAARVHGDTPTLLHSSQAGRPVYERMGYTPISTHTLFIEKKFLREH
jgi:GNAT superfamily N-acetyltransferase